MNNLKKVGLTALGTVLVAGSAQAATMSVSGGTSIFFGGEDNSNGGNGWSMTDQVTFSASGEMDNGMTISTSLQLDGTGAVGNAAPFDDRSLTIDTGDMGTIVFSGLKILLYPYHQCQLLSFCHQMEQHFQQHQFHLAEG